MLLSFHMYVKVFSSLSPPLSPSPLSFSLSFLSIDQGVSLQIYYSSDISAYLHHAPTMMIMD